MTPSFRPRHCAFHKGLYNDSRTHIGGRTAALAAARGPCAMLRRSVSTAGCSPGGARPRRCLPSVCFYLANIAGTKLGMSARCLIQNTAGTNFDPTPRRQADFSHHQGPYPALRALSRLFPNIQSIRSDVPLTADQGGPIGAPFRPSELGSSPSGGAPMPHRAPSDSLRWARWTRLPDRHRRRWRESRTKSPPRGPIRRYRLMNGWRCFCPC